MVSRLHRAQKKCATYVQKLDASPYYLAARILNPQCRTAFLKDENEDITTEGEKKVYVVRKLWERFRDQTQFSAVPYESESISKSALQPEENLSIFHKTRRKHILKQTRPQSQDEFDNYISENPIMLDSGTTAIRWWSQPIQRGRYPRLSQLAIEVLSIPGMSDKPERVFSGSRRRVPWDRTKTSAQMLEASECAKDWTVQGILGILL
jgi:hAT family C-terminal dimerisation region